MDFLEFKHQIMLENIHNHLDLKLIHEWQVHRHLSLESLKRLQEICRSSMGDHVSLERLNQAFNNSGLSRDALQCTAAQGSRDAGLLLEMLSSGSAGGSHCEILEDDLFHELSSQYWADQAGYLASGNPWYPMEMDGRKVGFRTDWVRQVLSDAAVRFQDFSLTRTSDLAIVVGNGPSLRNEDFSMLEGQDVFISNYAIKHPWLARIARGIAVSNPWVAAQEPYWFNLATCWKFFPFWHGNSIQYDESCVFLNACGGDLFFSGNVVERIAWHSTVTYFWLQILYSAGYRKVLLIGIDNSYMQPDGLKEGDLIDQDEDDLNHFDPSYFRGRRWQAADTGKMEETYAMAKVSYERDGREIVNCTSGGQLGLFRRSKLEQEIHRPATRVIRRPTSVPVKIDMNAAAIALDRRELLLIEPSDEKRGDFLIIGKLAGREIVAVVGINMVEGSKVDICLRGGSSRSCKSIILEQSGWNWISVKQISADNYEKVNCEVAINDEWIDPDGPIPLQMFVMESPSSVFNRLVSNDGLMAEANSLACEKRYLSSIPLYLYLAMIRPLEIYKTAARLSLGSLGVTAPAEQEEIFRQLGYQQHRSA